MIKDKINIVLIALLFIMIIGTNNLYAASISGSSNLKVGETITLTFDFGYNVAAYDSIDVQFNTDILEYVSGDSLHESVWYDDTVESNGIRTKSYTFKAIGDGSAKVVVVANGVVTASISMDEMGTVTAEKLITATNVKDEVKPQETPPASTVEPKPTASGNNYLRYLQIDQEGLSPNFTRNVTDYSLAVDENVNSIEVLAVAEDSNARVEITGNTNIVDGENEIQIKVTAPNGYYRIYTIVVTKSKDIEKSNAYLENLIVENYNLDRAFQAEVLSYNLGEILSTVKQINVVAIAKNTNAVIEIIGADSLVEEGEGRIVVKVTAEDGTTVKEYILNYTVTLADTEQVVNQDMNNYLKDIKNSVTSAQKAKAYINYIWTAVKKNYLLILMYLLILIELIQIIISRRRIKKLQVFDEGNEYNETNEIEEKEEKSLDLIESQTVENLSEKDETNNEKEIKEEEILNNDEINDLTLSENKEERIARKGSLDKEKNKENDEKIKLVDLDKDEGPKDEITFNIFDNLTDDDIKKMLEDEMDKGKNK